MNASTASILHPERLTMGNRVRIMDFAVIGQENFYQDIFENDRQRHVIIEDDVQIYPWCLVYEGATLRRGVVMEERTSVGSLTTIGEKSRILYQAQINDDVIVGEQCRIGGFVADHCRIGNRCSVFGALVHRYDQGGAEDWDNVDEEGPTLEDDVIIGWGAVIVGRVRIGAKARIAPLSVVKDDVEPGGRVRVS